MPAKQGSAILLTADDLMRLPPVPADHRLPYGADRSQFGELYLPYQPGPHPVVVLLHGGCWQAQFGLDHLGQLCSALREEGLAVWNMEYRGLGNGEGGPPPFKTSPTGWNSCGALLTGTPWICHRW